MKQLLLLVMLMFVSSIVAQVGIGTTTPDLSAELDVTSTNSGVLLPRISLTSTTDTATITSAATSLLIYNTATVSNVTPGFYYWDGSQWRPIDKSSVWRSFETNIPANDINERIYHSGQIVLGFNRNNGFSGQLESDFDASSNLLLYSAGSIGIGNRPNIDPLGRNVGYYWKGWRAYWNGDKIAAKITSDFKPSPSCSDDRVMDLVFSLHPGATVCAGETEDPTIEAMRLTFDGNLGIGTNIPTEKLHVNGNILASGTITPDYVFEKYFLGESSLKPNYNMMTLQEVEDYLKKEFHLPGVPSAKEVEQKGGILINRATEINLEKIEEIYLYIIELEKRIKMLESKTDNKS